MSKKEIRYYDIIKKVINKELNGSEAASFLKLSIRHVRRLKSKVNKDGAKGLVHGSRGKRGNRRLPDEEREQIIRLLWEKYSDFGPTFAAEKLKEKYQIDHHPSTIRQIMINEKLWTPRDKKGKRKKEHREWRQRKASYGEMLQYDGSYERWFEDRGERCCLIAAIDDATGKVPQAKFATDEGVEPTFGFWRGYIIKHGKPYSIYVDKFSTYSMNHPLAQENEEMLTEFKRAMERDLGIEVLTAHSPQAKGRVERLFGTLQDRLVKELRLNSISTIATANKFLEEKFLPEFNARFAVEPRSTANLHKMLTFKEQEKLDSIFSKQEERTVRNDFTVSYKKCWYQLLESQPATICKKDIVIIEERMDKSIHLRLRGKYLNFKLLPERPKKVEHKIPWVIPAGKTTAHTPAPDHPWRKIFNAEVMGVKANSRTFLNHAN